VREYSQFFFFFFFVNFPARGKNRAFFGPMGGRGGPHFLLSGPRAFGGGLGGGAIFDPTYFPPSKIFGQGLNEGAFGQRGGGKINFGTSYQIFSGIFFRRTGGCLTGRLVFPARRQGGGGETPWPGGRGEKTFKIFSFICFRGPPRGKEKTGAACCPVPWGGKPEKQARGFFFHGEKKKKKKKTRGPVFSHSWGAGAHQAGGRFFWGGGQLFHHIFFFRRAKILFGDLNRGDPGGGGAPGEGGGGAQIPGGFSM